MSSESSFSESDDSTNLEIAEYSYTSYKSESLDLYNSLQGEYDECKLVIAAVVQNNVTVLKDYLNFPEWWQTVNEDDGNSLLHIAILHRNREIFDYLLSHENCPLEHVNDVGKTPLALSLSCNLLDFCDYATYELIKRGASLESIQFEFGESLLHYVVEKSLVVVSKYLMEMGFDVNTLDDSGLPPLWYCIEAGSFDDTELMLALLYYGANPLIGRVYDYNMFEYAIRFCTLDLVDILYSFMFDQYTVLDMHFEVLLLLADDEFPFFCDVVEHTGEVIVTNLSTNYYYLLFVINSEYLKKIIEKCADAIQKVFAQVRPFNFRTEGLCFKMSLENVDLLVESNLKWDTINFIVDFIDKFYFTFLLGYEESVVFERLCYLLSYGLMLNESHLELFYTRYGYGELLKVLLHMDIKTSVTKLYIKGVFLTFIMYDITMDLDKYLENPCKYSLTELKDLLPYFVSKKLESLCFGDSKKPLNRPEVSLLVEMARNVFRKHFIKTFKIKNAKQFYALLNGLPISTIHKKIITYETKLY